MDYLCPEILKKEAYNQKIDVWCLGILLYEIYFGFTPFYSKEPKEKLANILAMHLQFPKNNPCSEDMKDLIQKLLQENPKARPEVSEIFEHKWMQKFYPIYNIDINNLNLTNSSTNNNESNMNLNDDITESLILRDSHLTVEYLQKNGLDNILEMHLKSMPNQTFQSLGLFLVLIFN